MMAQFCENVSPKKCLWFLVKDRLQNQFYLPTSEMHGTYVHVRGYVEPDQISHTQSMVAERGLTKWGKKVV